MTRQFKLLAATAASCLLLSVARSPAQDAVEEPRAEQARLAEHVQRHPTDYPATYRYVLLSRDLLDYEAGIGALERILMFNPDLARARKELGFLYARQGSYGLAAQNLREALDSGQLDPVQAAQIEAQLPDIEKQTQPNRLSVRFHTGFRSQTNANFFPTNGLFQVGGLGLGSLAPRRGDINTFQLVQASHDYDFQNALAVMETRVTAYATQQMNLPQYSVALFGGSTGPRFFVAPTFFDLSVRPYLTGAVSLLGSNNYLNTGGAGASIRADISPDIYIEPGAEWRSIWVDQGRLFGGVAAPFATLSTLATGDVVTGYAGGSYRYDNDIRLDGRVAYTRAFASFASQSSDQVDVQAMLRLEVDPPFPIIPRRWTIAPFARFTHLAFDAANPLVSPFAARRDAAWTYGIMLDAPVTADIGFNGHLEFARNDSNISNFSTRNVAVTFGPTLKF